MSELFHIDPKLDIPIYRQLVDVIKANIQNGKIPPMTKLPTVRDLSDELGIARGTIKRSYDELEHLGIIEKIRGRGTFVSYRPSDSESRKERASHQDKVKIGIVECNPETLYQLAEQLREIEQIDLFSYLLSDLREYPYKISEDMDLIITTAAHSDELIGIIPQSDKVIKTALTMMPKSVAGIIKIAPGEKVGIICNSEKFGNMLYELSETYTENAKISKPLMISRDGEITKYLSKKDVILVPENYQKYCSDKVLNQIRKFASKHRLIECSYQIDAGSFMYVRDKIEKLIDSKIL